MCSIVLKGNDKFLTLNPDKSYIVEKGIISVYVTAYEEGSAVGRRYWIIDRTKNMIVPSISIRDIDKKTWVFEFSGIGEAVIREIDADEDALNKFANELGIYESDRTQISEELLESINLRQVTEEGYIYATKQEYERTHEKGLSLIYLALSGKKINMHIDNTGNVLYDTVKLICTKQKIEIISYEEIKDSCGRLFSVNDIARISRFSLRQVILEENWYKKDSGPILAYSYDNKPIACIPVNHKKYIAYDLNEDTKYEINSETIEKISSKAFMFYRPFPNKSLNIKDLMFFGLNNVYKQDIAILFTFSCISTLIGLFIPFLTQKIYDKYILLEDINILVSICLLILTFMLGNLLFNIVKSLALLRVTNKMTYSIQSAIIDRLYNLSNNFLNKFESADLIKRTLGITTIFNLLSETIVTTLLSAFFSIFYLFWMFRYSNSLAYMGLIMLFINIVITMILGISQIRYEKKLLIIETKVASKLFQIISNISKIRIAGVENRALLQYLEPYIESKKLYFNKERITNLSKIINILFSCGFSMIFYYILIQKEVNINYGEFIAFQSSFGMFSSAMIECVIVFLNVNHTIPTYRRIKTILDQTKEIDEDVIIPGKIKGRIEINNLSFSYENKGERVIDNLSLKINPGEYIGIVGASGSGKSTLLKLLLGFEKPDLGKIYYDDTDMDRLDKRELRKKFGVVLQDGQLIGGSIYENISIASPDADLEKVNRVVNAVGLEDDIKQMPMGLHTVVSEGAGTISGGQRQRILIARAIMNNPKILFFDEATSALDNVNQSIVCKSLEDLNVTRVVIAHRLSTVESCDRILVMDKGEIVEQGTYKDLINLKGKFFNLVQRQVV